ncbi:PspC domain-containing protein [Patiriisocius sp. Uisw_047]|jgi:phage shock protein PspC (stress-responsive transcriptional regulator)|uniref:PspC domain-containing protein n=1 Tax=Patiriisocius sp. Uisw_047 TaxID=3230969 RepID=UPI0039E8C867
MKKTVNINLAGTFFHIDEDAFGKLTRYLDAIKKSLSDPQGSDEIIQDIEGRIAELFSEKIETNTQVISTKELDEVITVMGQPEDYSVDEEIFEDTPSAIGTRTMYNQLFRDIDNKFIAGVSSGLGHYFKIDAIWIRLIWIFLTLVTSGMFVIIYILLWILMPAAVSVSDKLKMNREAVTISNIEKKFKEGYEAVADGIKNADYDKYGKRIKKGSAGFFETLGNIIMTIFKIFGKFIGVLMVITGFTAVIALIIGLFTFGTLGIYSDGTTMDYFNLVSTTETPMWLMSLLALFAVGIPFLALAILGLKILIKNLRSIGWVAKIVLIVLWFAALIGIAIIAIHQVTEQAFDEEVITEHMVPIRSGETLQLEMRANNQYDSDVHRNYGLEIKYNENDEKLIYSSDIRLIVRSFKDSVGRMLIERRAEGNSTLDAKRRAEAIDYGFSIEDGKLILDGYLTSAAVQKFRDQEVIITLYLPEGVILNAAENTYSFHRNDRYYNDILDNGMEGYDLLIEDGKIQCLNCPEEEIEEMDADDDFTINITDLEVDINRDGSNINVAIDIDGDGESDLKVKKDTTDF